MRKILPILIISLFSHTIWSQIVFKENADFKADYLVFEVDREYKADLLVYIVDRDYKAKGDEGLWFFPDGDFKANFTVFFVDQDYKARWRNKTKMLEQNLPVLE